MRYAAVTLALFAGLATAMAESSEPQSDISQREDFT